MEKEHSYYKVNIYCINCKKVYIVMVPVGKEIHEEKTSGHKYYYKNTEDRINDLRTWITCNNCETISPGVIMDDSEESSDNNPENEY